MLGIAFQELVLIGIFAHVKIVDEKNPFVPRAVYNLLNNSFFYIVADPPRKIMQTGNVTIADTVPIAQSFEVSAEICKTVRLLPFCQHQRGDGFYQGGAI